MNAGFIVFTNSVQSLFKFPKVQHKIILQYVLLVNEMFCWSK